MPPKTSTPAPDTSQAGDAATETDRHARYQANAPRVEAGLYLVPKVIE